MNYKQNLHTHSSYCDGADTPEEIIICGIEKGFTSIGFSGHSYMSYSRMFAEKGDATEEYKIDVLKLKEKYTDKIEIYLGLEVDMYSEPDMSGYDYLIGSVHYLKCGDKIVGFDRDADEVENVIKQYFDGDGLEYAKAYYKAMAELPHYGNFDIIAHFDLITKHCENKKFFDIESKEYINAALETMDALSGKIPFFELNTGAIARGYRTSPYPSMTFLKEFKRRGFGAIITSDCHDKNMLDYGFDDAVEILKSCGFEEKYILTKNGFSAVAL